MRSIPRPLIGLYAAAQLPLDYSIKFYRQLQDNIRVNRRGTDRLRLRAPARPRCPVSQCLKIRSAWVNKNQSQYAVTTIKIAEKTNLESRSCVIGGNSKCLAAIKKQSRRAEYDRPTTSPCWVRMGTISGADTSTALVLRRNETRSLI